MSESRCFFNFLSTIKVNLVLKSCKVLIYVLFFISSTKTTISLGFNLIYKKSKMATIIGDVTGPSAAPLPIKYTSSCTEDQRFSTEGKTLSGVGPSTHLYHGGGKNLHVRPKYEKQRYIYNPIIQQQ